MNSSIESKHHIQTQRIVETCIIVGLFFFNFSPISNISIRFILLLAFLFTCLFQKTFHSTNNVKSFIAISIISIFMIFYHGLAEAKDFFIFCFGILSTSYFAKKHTFSGNIIYKYFIYIIIPLSILNLLIYNNVYYFPFSTGYVNIIGKDATKHATAIIGTLLFIGSAYNIINIKEHIQNKDIVLFILGIYFVAFSGSRSGILAIIATIILYIINRNRYKKLTTFIYIFTIIFVVFILEYLQDYVHLIKNEFILNLIGAEDFKKHGVTSGRAWLWNVHWDSFVNSPFLLGGGRDVVDFKVRDYIPFLRMRALAGSESPYTGMLACNGIIGILQICILLRLLYYGIIKENILATCIIFICIYNTIMGCDYTNVLQANPILIYLLYFTSLKNKKTSIQKKGFNRSFSKK